MHYFAPFSTRIFLSKIAECLLIFAKMLLDFAEFLLKNAKCLAKFFKDVWSEKMKEKMRKIYVTKKMESQQKKVSLQS